MPRVLGASTLIPPARALTAVRPADAVTAVQTIPLRLSEDGGFLDRLYLGVQSGGRRETIIVDSGTARTWLQDPSAAQEWTDDAFVATIGGQALSVLGRKVPSFTETVDGRPPIGALGNDFLTTGPTELDLRGGKIVRYPVGARIAGTESWPTLPLMCKRGILYVRLEVEGKSRLMQLDTGCADTVLISDRHGPGDRESETNDVYGHRLVTWSGMTHLRLCGAGADVPLDRMPSFPHFENDVARALGVKLEGILGLSALGRRRIVIDVASGVLRLGP